MFWGSGMFFFLHPQIQASVSLNNVEGLGISYKPYTLPNLWLYEQEKQCMPQGCAGSIMLLESMERYSFSCLQVFNCLILICSYSQVHCLGSHLCWMAEILGTPCLTLWITTNGGSSLQSVVLSSWTSVQIQQTILVMPTWWMYVAQWIKTGASTSMLC